MRMMRLVIAEKKDVILFILFKLMCKNIYNRKFGYRSKTLIELKTNDSE
jgi:hypothetical protein